MSAPHPHRDNAWTDSLATSVDWEKLARPLAVLPLGSCEQHGTHLPLALDTILVDYFGRHLARELGAALLPPLPIGQCFEHSGFRGSLSLQPETYMALIRDLVDALEAQHFKRLVILNGHGGNQSVGPVVRDINRRDRPIRVLLVSWPEFDASDAGEALGHDSLHADAWETAVALAVCPDRVGDWRAAAPLPGEPDARREDLNQFGVGVLRPAGVWSDPRRASLEAGRAIVDSVNRRMPAAVRERLAWFDRHPTYAGDGRIVVRPMEAWDIEEGVRLSRAASWNQLRSDWTAMWTLFPPGCFVAAHNGAVVGTTLSVDYDSKVSWIGCVLVDPAMRRRGIATLLMQAALQALAACETVKLDATPAGRQVYLKLGFVDEYELLRTIVSSAPAVPPEPGVTVRRLEPGDLAAAAAMDADVFGVARPAVLTAFRELAPEYALIAERAGRMCGFALGRHGANAEYLGPITADDPAAARALAGHALTALRGRAVILDTPASQREWLTWLRGLGFAEQRVLIRMARGPNRYPGQPARTFAIAGPEVG